MNLYICGSNRKKNSYNLLNKIKTDKDILVSLSELQIKYCLGCNACQKNKDNSNDDMKIIYNHIEKSDKIIIMSPVYMNHITGILKNVLDRFNPYCASEKLRNKKVMLITVGQMSEEEQQDIVNQIKIYFESLSEFFFFDFEFLYNFTSGDIIDTDSIDKMYSEKEINKIIAEIKEKIGE